MEKFKERKNIKLSAVAEEILKTWDKENTFKKSISSRSENNPFVFYEEITIYGSKMRCIRFVHYFLS